jgi:hypothetical protein
MSKKDTLYLRSTQIHKVKKMLTMILLPAVWAFFTGYLLWYTTSAKQNTTITANDAKILWKMHKNNTNCAGHRWHLTKCESGKISGFECACGYKYTPKRPIVSSKPRVSN